MSGDEFIQKHNLKPGDTIVAKFKNKFWGLKSLFHYVVYLGDDIAIHNIPNEGVVFITMDEIAEDYPEIARIERYTGDVRSLLKRAKQAFGRQYSLMEFNCESLANYIRGRGPKSIQVRDTATKVMGGFLIFVCISLIFKAAR